MSNFSWREKVLKLIHFWFPEGVRKKCPRLYRVWLFLLRLWWYPLFFVQSLRYKYEKPIRKTEKQFTVYILPSDQRNRAIEGFKEDIWIRNFRNASKEADVIVDIGANYGEFILFLDENMLKPGALIWAFEPNPKVYECLQKNLEVNGYNEMARSFKLGLGAKMEKATFNLNVFSSGFSSLLDDHSITMRRWGGLSLKVPIEITTLDYMINLYDLTYDMSYLIKVDTEGYDLEVLYGGKDLLTRAKSVFVIFEYPEDIDYFFQKHQEFVSFILDKFDIYSVLEDRLVVIKSLPQFLQRNWGNVIALRNYPSYDFVKS